MHYRVFLLDIGFVLSMLLIFVVVCRMLIWSFYRDFIKWQPGRLCSFRFSSSSRSWFPAMISGIFHLFISSVTRTNLYCNCRLPSSSHHSRLFYFDFRLWLSSIGSVRFSAASTQLLQNCCPIPCISSVELRLFMLCLYTDWK